MYKLVLPCLLAVAIFASGAYTGGTTAVVTLVGGLIKAKSVEIEKKYPRKDCPVCKGAGWYWSGDGIKKVECGYCEPDKKLQSPPQSSTPPRDCKTQVIKK